MSENNLMKNREREYEKRYAKKRQWLLDGKCRECGSDDVIKSNFCLKDYLIRVSAKRLGTGSHWKELISLLEKQNFKCALTSKQISFKDGIELDHIVPISKQGTKQLSNVRWVTKEANRLKQNLTDAELKELCINIINNLSL